ncbi:TAP-like protein-domain-containing protein [Trametes maxima]|nr:TAP-like protein-domain-containing protein [Trametes maxima]
MRHFVKVASVSLLAAVWSVRGRGDLTQPQGENCGNNSTTVQWGPCDPTVIQDPSLSCTFFEVPLDYHDPSAGHGRLALAKVNATGTRRGTVFLNPGGPGGSGLQVLNATSATLLALTGGNYDIVSWDPRGVGSLTIPGDISCFDNDAEYIAFWNGTIELSGIEMTGNFSDPQDVQALLSQAHVMQTKYEELGQRCLQHPSGKFLKYVGTAATARDIVALADALDGPGSPVNFAGTSYGSLLGSWLIQMFPERIGRVLLDGIIDPVVFSQKETPFWWTDNELADADKVYEGFITGCALSGHAGCPIASTDQGQSPEDVDASIQALLQRAHDAARMNSSVPFTSAVIRESLLGVMYTPVNWTRFARAVLPAFEEAVHLELSNVPVQVGSGLLRLLGIPDRNAAKSYTPVAILCGDSVDRRGTTMEDVFKNIISSSKSGSKQFSAAWHEPFFYCPFWPVRAVERYQGPFNKKLANKILVVSNTFDPVTPLAGAEAVVKNLGDDAALVEQHGFGHVSVAEPSQCFNAIAFTYFATGAVPEQNRTMCEVDADFELFKGVNTAAVLASLA